jgi:hypothetical protein
MIEISDFHLKILYTRFVLNHQFWYSHMKIWNENQDNMFKRISHNIIYMPTLVYQRKLFDIHISQSNNFKYITKQRSNKTSGDHKL